MATINIGQSNAGDEFYRYKMPALQSKIEGRGNGIKTNVMNMVDVAKALGRPASYTTKYFGTELGAQTKFDEASGLAIVNGAHETNRLSQLLEGFIKRFVQCGQCNNPETEIVLTKKETIELHCKACGAVTQVDMRHKLCTFILKNPPVVKDKSKKLRRAEKERMKEGEAIDKAEKEARKKAKHVTHEHVLCALASAALTPLAPALTPPGLRRRTKTKTRTRRRRSPRRKQPAAMRTPTVARSCRRQ